jgi:NAD(P)H-hydrate epimerase
MENRMKVSRVAEMRDLDKMASQQFGIVDVLLMENAGLAVYSVLSNEFGIQGKKFLVICGPGNNGGDGLVVARKIHSNSGHVKVFILGNPDNFKGAAKTNLDIVTRLPIEVQRLGAIELTTEDISWCDAIVDAILGTGLTRKVEGLYRAVIELINASGKTVLSVDIPSGVHGDTGQIMGTAIRADYTVTFGLPKIGNMLFPGYDRCGNLYVSHISFPPAIYCGDSLKIATNQPGQLPYRDKDGHNRDFGETLVIAGATSYFGAPDFAASSFLKAGGGHARLAAPASITPFVANKSSEIVFVPQQETSAGSIALKNKRMLLELSERMDMVILGPGLSRVEETQQLVRELVRETNRPLLLDGDGISAVCQDLKCIKTRPAETILTPHLGEMSKLTKLSVSEIEADIINVLQRTARELKAMVVLKGAHSLIGYPDGQVRINLSGNFGMTAAGSSDVLSGTIAAMFGLGLALTEAVSTGVFIHGLAGDLAAEVIGEDGLTAQDILNYLPVAVKIDREGLSAHLRDRYAGACLV